MAETAQSLNESDTNSQRGGHTTIDPSEVAKFTAIAEEWWDPTGKFKPLHKFNPVRLAFIRDTICKHFDREPLGPEPLAGLRLIDVGCGGGLVAEPMSRLGATVTAIDAAERNIKTALTHASQSGLDIDYRNTTVEDLLEAKQDPFDVVLNLEVVEHVADVDLFLRSSAELVKPGGVMILATINRTLKALATAKIAAEYVLRWLPAGTHDPRKFVKPQEAQQALAAGNMQLTSTVGVSYNPLADKWTITNDPSVNYMLVAVKKI